MWGHKICFYAELTKIIPNYHQLELCCLVYIQSYLKVIIIQHFLLLTNIYLIWTQISEAVLYFLIPLEKNNPKTSTDYKLQSLKRAEVSQTDKSTKYQMLQPVYFVACHILFSLSLHHPYVDYVIKR